MMSFQYPEKLFFLFFKQSTGKLEASASSDLNNQAKIALLLGAFHYCKRRERESSFFCTAL